MKKGALILFTILMFFCFVSSPKAVYTDANVGSYENELANFPCDYQTKIKELHKIYPNAVFVAQTEFFDWNKYKEVPVKWSDMLSAETASNKSWIAASQPTSYRTSTCRQWSGSTCTWYEASKAGVTYYLNPYNFLSEKYVFMFESQLYNPNQTKDGIENMFSGSAFLYNKNCPGSSKTYSEVIMEAAQKHGLSAYMLAARIKQEQGSGTSPLITGKYTGYEGYYNYFNINANGSTTDEIAKNGLAYAKEQGWDTPYKSIIGGAEFLRTKYIGANDKYNVKGQMTGYLQKWDPYGPKYAGQQYMQNIMAPYSEAASTYKTYSSFSNYKNLKYVFYIPIFTSAPNTTNTSCNTSSSGSSSSIPYTINGSYISGIAQGTSASTVASKSGGSVTNSSGSSKTSGNIATGDKVKVGNNTYTVVIYGDVNGDGKISSIDYVKIKNHITGATKLSGASLKAADANKDGNVKSVDYVKVKNHITGNSKITQ